VFLGQRKLNQMLPSKSAKRLSYFNQDSPDTQGDTLCLECNLPFHQQRRTQRFHCRQCKDDYHNRIKREKLKFAEAQGYDEAAK